MWVFVAASCGEACSAPVILPGNELLEQAKLSDDVGSAIVNPSYSFQVDGCKIVITKHTPILCQKMGQDGIAESQSTIYLGETDISVGSSHGILQIMPNASYMALSNKADEERSKVQYSGYDTQQRLSKISDYDETLLAQKSMKTDVTIKMCGGQLYKMAADLSDFSIQASIDRAPALADEIRAYHEQYCQ